MKEKILVLLIFGLMLMTATPVIFAGNVDNVTVTLSPQATASIIVNQSSWTPDAGLGESESTAGDWATLTNNGLVQVDVTIKANNTNDWTLSSSAGHNKFLLQWLVKGNSEKRFEYIPGYQDRVSSVTNTKWFGQYFEVGEFGPNEVFYPSKIKFYVYSYGSYTGTYYASIRNAGASGLPIGSDLINGSTSVSLSSGYHWVEIPLTGSYCLQPGEGYTVTIHTSFTGSEISVNRNYDFDGLYDEDMSYSSNGGVSWSHNGPGFGADDDLCYELYGYNVSATDISITPSSFISNLSPVSGNNTQNFGLRIQMPTTSSTTQNQQTEITFTATAD